MNKTIEFLILDYDREEESISLLKSIKENCDFEYKVTFLDNNGGNKSYPEEMFRSGYIDNLIVNKVNVGCGAATIQLFAQCMADYAFYIQVDHKLITKLNEQIINHFIHIIEKEKKCYVDLSGNQGHGKYSERAQFISPKFYNSIPKVIGGPGPWEDVKWTEECVQDYIEKNNLEFQSVYIQHEGRNYPIFMDCGKWSVRSNPDGSQWKHRTDTKELYCLKKPTEKFTYPKLTEEEWQEAIKGEWPKNGKIPEKQVKDSFNCWGII